MKTVLAGGSGVLGRRLARDLSARGHEVVVLTRSATEIGHGRPVIWDGRTVGSWAGELAGAAVVNLCGAIIDRRPTAANIDLLTRSRVEPTQAAGEGGLRPGPAPAGVGAGGNAGHLRRRR